MKLKNLRSILIEKNKPTISISKISINFHRYIVQYLILLNVQWFVEYTKIFKDDKNNLIISKKEKRQE